MPSLFKMTTDAKDSTAVASEVPVVITQMAAPAPKSRVTKKTVIIAVSAVLVVAIIVAAILLGMHMFTEGQKEILKYTMNVNKDTKEEITADQNENVVEYHVQNANYEMWVIDDFNRDIQVLKIQTKSGTNCYALPLNRTNAADPTKVTAPSNVDTAKNTTERLTYDVASTPIPDTSFMGKTAKETCKGISVYWMYPKCGEGPGAAQRMKRDTCYDCYFYYYYYNYNYYLRYVCYWYYCW